MPKVKFYVLQDTKSGSFFGRTVPSEKIRRYAKDLSDEPEFFHSVKSAKQCARINEKTSYHPNGYCNGFDPYTPDFKVMEIEADLSSSLKYIP